MQRAESCQAAPGTSHGSLRGMTHLDVKDSLRQRSQSLKSSGPIIETRIIETHHSETRTRSTLRSPSVAVSRSWPRFLATRRLRSASCVRVPVDEECFWATEPCFASWPTCCEGVRGVTATCPLNKGCAPFGRMLLLALSGRHRLAQFGQDRRRNVYSLGPVLIAWNRPVFFYRQATARISGFQIQAVQTRTGRPSPGRPLFFPPSRRLLHLIHRCQSCVLLPLGRG